MTHPNTDQGVTAEVTQGWQNCRIGSCLRHEACMYRPCRAPKDVDALEAEIASLKQRLESAEGEFKQIQVAAGMMRVFGLGTTQDEWAAEIINRSKAFLQEQEKQNG